MRELRRIDLPRLLLVLILLFVIVFFILKFSLEFLFRVLTLRMRIGNYLTSWITLIIMEFYAHRWLRNVSQMFLVS